MSPASRSKRALPARAEAAWEGRALDQAMRGGRERVLSRTRKIVDAAHTIVGERGIDGLTLRSLLGEAGISRRAFYERFEGKDDLLLALFEQTLQNAADSYRQAIAPIDDPLARLRHLVVGLITAALSEHVVRHSMAMSREHLRLAEARPGDLRRALQPLTDLIAEQLTAGLADGTCRPMDVHETAILIHNLVSSTLHHALLADRAAAEDEETGRPQRVEAMAAAVWEFCRCAVTAGRQ